jgi:hypothetical protein
MIKREGPGSAYGSGSIIKRHGSANPDPDPHQNVMDPELWFLAVFRSRDILGTDPASNIFLLIFSSTGY